MAVCDSNSIKYTCNKQGKRKFILELAGRSARSARRINLCPLDHLSCGGQLGGFSSSFLQNLKKKTIISDVCFRDVSSYSNDFANIGVIEASRARFYKEGRERGEGLYGYLFTSLFVFARIKRRVET